MKQKFIEWFTKNNNGCSPAMEDDRSFVREKTQHMFEAYQAGLAEGEARCAALAAENAGLKEKIDKIAAWPNSEFYASAWEFNNNDGYALLKLVVENDTPATDSFLDEVRAQGVEMFADDLLCPDLDSNIREFAAQLRKGVQS